ncbi:MAG TPA: hypothetical protein VE127_11350, partial [Solirubrobacteraceae bacterium]|nr:hypothetical protein [Solirubrobacteraceae bacterium]
RAFVSPGECSAMDALADASFAENRRAKGRQVGSRHAGQVRRRIRDGFYPPGGRDRHLTGTRNRDPRHFA